MSNQTESKNMDRRFPKHTEADIIFNICVKRMHELYGEKPHSDIKERLDAEMAQIIVYDNETVYWIAMRIVEESNKQGFHIYPRGCEGSSFVAYLLGITGINPLKAHYLCPNCNFFEYTPNAASGYDLWYKFCPKCAYLLISDGHNIPFESFAGLDGEKAPDIDFNVTDKFHVQAPDILQSLFPDDVIVRAGTRNKHGEPGIHPGGWFVIPKQYADSVPTMQICLCDGAEATVTEQHCHELDKMCLKMDILPQNTSTILTKLSMETEVCLENIPMNDDKVIKLFTNGNTDGVPDFGTPFVKDMIKICKPANFSDLVKINGLCYGTNVWTKNAEFLIKDGVATLGEVLAHREDVYQYLTDCGMNREDAYQIMETTRRGLAYKDLLDSDFDDFERYNLPEWFSHSIMQTGYMFPKAHGVSCVKAAMQMAWFKVYHKKLFDAAIAEVKQKD